MPKSASPARLLVAALLPLAITAQDPRPKKPWQTPLLDSLNAYVSKGDMRTADSLVRAQAQELLESPVLGDFATAALLLMTGNLDSVLSMAAGDRPIISPMFSRDLGFALVLGHAKEAVDRRVDSAYGNTAAASALKLIRDAMTDFVIEAKVDSLYDEEWYYKWKISPTRQRLNDKVLDHFIRYGNSPYDRILGETVYFRVERHKIPFGANILEGGGGMDGRDAGPVWWRSTSYFLEYRSPKWFAYLKIGRAVGGLGLAYYLLESQRFVLSPYAGISQYPFVTLGEYENTRPYTGPDIGLNLDWKFKIWKPPRALLNLYWRTNAGMVVDPDRFSANFHRTSFVYLNFGVGINMDAFALHIPYVRDGRIRFHRELNWR